jgi:hypothetical protein
MQRAGTSVLVTSDDRPDWPTRRSKAESAAATHSGQFQAEELTGQEKNAEQEILVGASRPKILVGASRPILEPICNTAALPIAEDALVSVTFGLRRKSVATAVLLTTAQSGARSK